MKNKNILSTIITAASLVAVFSARAQDDVILVLWANNYDTVNFDLGNISQFQNHTNGYQVQVTNWDPNVVTTYFGPFPADGGFISLNFNLDAASTSDNIPYVTDTVAPNYITSTLGLRSDANDLYNYDANVFSTGVNDNPIVAASSTNNYSVYAPSSPAAYDHNNTGTGERQWGTFNLSSGQVYAGIPGAINFWQIGVNTATNLGTFQFTADGRLFFTAGTLLDKTIITDFEYDGVSEADVTFNTKLSANYRLLESTNAALPLSSWTVVNKAVVDYPDGGTSTGSVTGDGESHTLSNLNASNTPAFYRIQSY